MGFQTYPPDSGNGTVTTVSVVSANGFSGSVANPTTTPAITLTMDADGLGEIVDGLAEVEAIAADDKVLIVQNVLVLTGAGTAGANGSYTYRGEDTGYPYYNIDGQAADPTATDAISVFSSGGGLRAVVGGTAAYYRSNLTIDNYADIYDALQDLVTVNGSNPVPTVTAVPTAFTTGAETDILNQFTTTATAAGTTTLTVDSTGIQAFTGSTTQTMVLPVVTTLPQTGYSYTVINNSTGAVTVNSSGANLVQLMAAGSRATFICVLLTGTTAASWTVEYTPAVSTTIVDSDTNPVAGNAVFDGLALKAGGNATDNLGYLNIPQNSTAVDYTLVLGDAGKHIYETGASKTITIPANASVAYPIGTAVTFIATDAGGCSIAITTDTLRWAQDGSTGTRTLAQYGIASAIKVTSTVWIISGVGLT